jgi:hypothetical protein
MHYSSDRVRVTLRMAVYRQSVRLGHMPLETNDQQSFSADSLRSLSVLLTTPLHGPSIKHSFQQYLYCCMRIRCRGNLFTESLPRNGSGIFSYLEVVA